MEEQWQEQLETHIIGVLGSFSQQSLLLLSLPRILIVKMPDRFLIGC